jgi:RNA-directed DNA polymerase
MAHMVKKRKVHSLTGRIDDRLMMQAFKAVKRNRGAAGIDKVSIGMFEENLDANLTSLQRDLKTKGSFVPLRCGGCGFPKTPRGQSFDR